MLKISEVLDDSKTFIKIKSFVSRSTVDIDFSKMIAANDVHEEYRYYCDDVIT